jgi:hypothetical protein
MMPGGFWRLQPVAPPTAGRFSLLAGPEQALALIQIMA